MDENFLFNDKNKNNYSNSKNKNDNLKDAKFENINLNNFNHFHQPKYNDSCSYKQKEDSFENLDETQVEFKIFISIKNKTKKYNNKPRFEQIEIDINEKDDDDDDDENEINNFYQEMVDYLETLTSNYIWNNERFYLNRPIRTNIQPEFCTPKFNQNPIDYTCYGCVDFGDNINDEWFITYLLYKLTSKFSGKIAAKINDIDGEFLLIHAANYLPDWASTAADNCMNNRVFIYDGQLHIIPPATNPSQITYCPSYGSIKNSLHGANVVFDFPVITRASDSIQDSISKQLNMFEPDIIGRNMYHRATCSIPAKLAWLLKSNPCLISSAINRFCEKDPKDLKLCNTLNTFKPVDLVNYRVSFTKHLYGKLKYSDYKPEKRHNWPALNNILNETVKPTDQVLYNINKERSILGFKLTCAFEIISKQILNDQIEDKSFENYIRKLRNLGYFKDYIENSKNYNELMEKAKYNFENDKQESNLDKYSNMIDSFYLDKIISEDYVVKLKEEITNVQEKETDDSDDWLCVEAPQLDDYLDMYSRGDVGSTYDFRIISNAFKNFMKRPDKNKKEDLLQGVDYKTIDKKNEDKLIDFNPEIIEDNLKDILKMGSNEKKKSAKSDKLDYDLDDANDLNDDESDSFYEIDDDMLDHEDDLEDQDNLKNYMSSMDKELKEEKNLTRLNPNSDDLDIDLNLVSNALESYSSQLGLTGPVSNILKSLGL